MKFLNLLIAVTAAVNIKSEAEENPEAQNVPNVRHRALQVRKDRKHTFRGSDNKETATRAMCRQTWRGREKILECMKTHGVYPRHYEDKLEKQQDRALESCTNITNPAQRRKCYNDNTSKTHAGAAFSTQPIHSKVDCRVLKKKHCRQQDKPLTTKKQSSSHCGKRKTMEQERKKRVEGRQEHQKKQTEQKEVAKKAHEKKVHEAKQEHEKKETEKKENEKKEIAKREHAAKKANAKKEKLQKKQEKKKALVQGDQEEQNDDDDEEIAEEASGSDDDDEATMIQKAEQGCEDEEVEEEEGDNDDDDSSDPDDEGL